MSLEQQDLKYIWHPCSQMKDYEELSPIIIEKGKGIYLYDIYGKEYIDIISSWWCNLLGHSNEYINESIKNQLDNIEHIIFANFSHKPIIDLSRRLVSLTPYGLNKCFYSDNGSSSVEVALKMSFQYYKQKGYINRDNFMCLSGGYHGETIGALSVGSIGLYSDIYKPILINKIEIKAPDCYRCPFNKDRADCNIECFIYAEEQFEKYGDKTCALIIEPLLQGASGMRIYPYKYIEMLRQICDEYNVLLIADEIATGFGRLGKMFAFDYGNISPDIMCLSKGLTGGYIPMAVTLTTDELYNAFYDDYNTFKAFMHSHTYSGNPLGASAANAVLDILINSNIISTVSKKGQYIKDQLTDRLKNHKYIGEIRNIGIICAIEIVEDKISKKSFDYKKRIGYSIYKEALKEGLLLRPLGDVIYFNPPLIITNKEIDMAVDKAVISINRILDNI